MSKFLIMVLMTVCFLQGCGKAASTDTVSSNMPSVISTDAQ